MFKFAITAACIAMTTPALAQNFGTPAEGEILSGWREGDGQHIAGLSIRLAAGWKTYWRAPGDGGIPPRFNWSGSRNLADVQVQFPVPQVMDQYGIRTIGYERDVVFPLMVTAKDPSKPIELYGEIDMGVCEEVCLPYRMEVSGMLPETGAYDAAIGSEMENRPTAGGQFACQIEPIADGLRVVAEARLNEMSNEAAVVEGGEHGTWVSEPILQRNGETLTATVEMVPPAAQPFALARNDVRLTVIGREGAVEFVGCR